jgi:hypothetical protein
MAQAARSCQRHWKERDRASTIRPGSRIPKLREMKRWLFARFRSGAQASLALRVSVTVVPLLSVRAPTGSENRSGQRARTDSSVERAFRAAFRGCCRSATPVQSSVSGRNAYRANQNALIHESPSSAATTRNVPSVAESSTVTVCH